MTKEQEIFYKQVSQINYKISTHEGNANTRLASQCSKILLLPKAVIPEKYQEKFNKLLKLIENTLNPIPGLLIPVKIDSIYNKTAVKYIILLIELEDYFADLNC